MSGTVMPPGTSAADSLIAHAPNGFIENVATRSAEQSAVPSARRGMGKAFWVAIAWLALVLFMAIFGRWLPFVKSEPDFLAGINVSDGKWLQTFGRAHPFGVDSSGNDWLSLLILGSKNSLVIALATIFIGFVVGGGLGMMAGYRRGWIDTVTSFVITVLLSVPPLLFILMLVSVLSAGGDSGIDQGLQTSVAKLSVALGILSIPTIYRVVRGATITFASREFVLAARAMGAKPGRVLFREIFPNVAKPMLAYGLVAAGSVMVIEGSLSFLGIGVGDVWAWGRMIQSGASERELRTSPHIVLIPAVALFLTVFSFNFVGDKIRERLEVKEGNI
jgi:peptide/nickel transport system permease protein